jgi:hypothetical protein
MPRLRSRFSNEHAKALFDSRLNWDIRVANKPFDHRIVVAGVRARFAWTKVGGAKFAGLNPPTMGKTIIALVAFCLFFAVSIRSRPQSESNGSRRGRTHEFSASDLEQDQKLFADDIRKLRRDLRRGVPAAIVDFEREEVRQDWVHIIMDRGLSGAGPAPTVLDLARLPASTKRPRCCCTAEPGGPSV